MTMRGLTCAYLLRRIAHLDPGSTVLLYAAAGGVGLIFTQWARQLGVNVIGTVSTDEKAEIAQAHGCTHTIVYTREDDAARVRELTDGAGVPVAYDSIGRTTVPSSLDSLSRRGLLFDHVGSGRITVEINQRYALDDAVSAHRDLESGRSVGSSVFVLES
jgi:NADPH2:quinone reductase